MIYNQCFYCEKQCTKENAIQAGRIGWVHPECYTENNPEKENDMSCTKCNDSGNIISHGAFGEPEQYPCPECEYKKKHSFDASSQLTFEIVKQLGFCRKFRHEPDDYVYQRFVNAEFDNYEIYFKQSGAYVENVNGNSDSVPINTVNKLLKALIVFSFNAGRQEKANEIKKVLGIV